jgi:hypothetical protein
MVQPIPPLEKMKNFFRQNWKFMVFWIVGMCIYKTAELLGIL